MSSRISQGYWMSKDFSASVDEVDGEVHCFSFQSLSGDQFNGLFSLGQLIAMRTALDGFIRAKSAGPAGGAGSGAA